jgi:hypothetical protein
MAFFNLFKTSAAHCSIPSHSPLSTQFRPLLGPKRHAPYPTLPRPALTSRRAHTRPRTRVPALLADVRRRRAIHTWHVPRGRDCARRCDGALACTSALCARAAALCSLAARPVLRVLEPEDAPDDARSPPRRLAEACVPRAPTARTRVAALTRPPQARSRAGTVSTSSRSRTIPTRRSRGRLSPPYRAAGPMRARPAMVHICAVGAEDVRRESEVLLRCCFQNWLSPLSPLPRIGWCRSARVLLPGRSSHLGCAAGERRPKDT